MKRILTIIAISLLVSCSPSPEQKAKTLIDKELKTTLHDYKSYEPVEFGKIDSSFTRYEDQPNSKEQMKIAEDALEDSKECTSKMKIYSGLSTYYYEFEYYKKKNKRDLEICDSILQIIKKDKADFKPTFEGWKINHSYRAKALNGNLGIHHYTYFLDKDFKSILRSVDISESSK